MEEIKFTIPLTPISKKNSQQIFINSKTGKPFISPSKKYKEYERAAVAYCPRNLGIEAPVNISCVYYMPTKRKCDLTNLLEATHDVLVCAQTIKDDNYNIISSVDGSEVKLDRENPRTEVTITFLQKNT